MLVAFPRSEGDRGVDDGVDRRQEACSFFWLRESAIGEREHDERATHEIPFRIHGTHDLGGGNGLGDRPLDELCGHAVTRIGGDGVEESNGRKPGATGDQEQGGSGNRIPNSRCVARTSSPHVSMRTAGDTPRMVRTRT